jgi:hypothetical protein
MGNLRVKDHGQLSIELNREWLLSNGILRGRDEGISLPSEGVGLEVTSNLEHKRDHATGKIRKVYLASVPHGRGEFADLIFHLSHSLACGRQSVPHETERRVRRRTESCNGCDADHDDECKHHGVFDRRGAVFLFEESNDFLNQTTHDDPPHSVKVSTIGDCPDLWLCVDPTRAND